MKTIVEAAKEVREYIDSLGIAEADILQVYEVSNSVIDELMRVACSVRKTKREARKYAESILAISLKRMAVLEEVHAKT
jgi:hypothetical protein